MHGHRRVPLCAHSALRLEGRADCSGPPGGLAACGQVCRLRYPEHGWWLGQGQAAHRGLRHARWVGVGGRGWSEGMLRGPRGLRGDVQPGLRQPSHCGHAQVARRTLAGTSGHAVGLFERGAPEMRWRARHVLRLDGAGGRPDAEGALQLTGDGLRQVAAKTLDVRPGPGSGCENTKFFDHRQAHAAGPGVRELRRGRGLPLVSASLLPRLPAAALDAGGGRRGSRCIGLDAAVRVRCMALLCPVIVQRYVGDVCRGKFASET
mmetsp:Transcript_73642/g.239797  ORF Transcript_73642/g.239797 Transcript_73642/m.239797 type:complete len:263 (-) Transcript_73642:251-1039(-)